MAAAAVAAGWVATSASQAATWDGDVSQVANVAQNWVGDVLPAAGEVITFSNLGGGTITYNLSGSQNPVNVIFDATANQFTLTNGTTIQLTTPRASPITARSRRRCRRRHKRSASATRRSPTISAARARL